MALFGNKKKKEEVKKAPAKKPAVSSVAPTKSATKVVPETVLLKPRITEKAANLTANHVYTFDVRLDATKRDIAAAIEAVYRVKPKKVRIVKTVGKRVRLRTRRGMGARSGKKKAYVYLKEGDRIEFSA